MRTEPRSPTPLLHLCSCSRPQLEPLLRGDGAAGGKKPALDPKQGFPQLRPPPRGPRCRWQGATGRIPQHPARCQRGRPPPKLGMAPGWVCGGASECVPPLPPSPRTWQRAEGHLSPSARGAVPSGSERGASSPRMAPCQLPAAVPAPSPLARGCRAGRRLGAPRDSSQAARALSSCPEEGGGTARKVLGWPISGALQPAPPTPSPWWVCGTGWVPAPLLGFRTPQCCCLSQLCFRTCLRLPLHPEASLRPARHRRGRG